MSGACSSAAWARAAGRMPTDRPSAARFARSRRTEGHAGDETLQILDAGQVPPQPPAGSDLPRQFIDRVQPVDDRLARRERPLEPRAEHTAAHRGVRQIDLRKKRTGSTSLGAGKDLEVLEGRGVDDEMIRPRPELQGPEMFELGPLCIPQVAHEPSRGPYGRGVLVRNQAEAVQRRRAELPEQGLQGLLEIEERGLGGGDRHVDVLDSRQACRVEVPGQQDLPGPDGGQLVDGRPGRRVPVVLRDPQLARGEIGGREAENGGRAVTAPGDGHEERRLACFQGPRIRVRAGGDHPDDLAANDAPGLARILDLLAHGDPEPLFDEAREVRVGRVPWHAAHRNFSTAAIFGTRREGELQNPGRSDRVLVEHLVEVTHPEEDQGIGVLSLGLQVLAHRRRRPLAGGGRRLDGGRHRARW